MERRNGDFLKALERQSRSTLGGAKSSVTGSVRASMRPLSSILFQFPVQGD